MIRELSIRHFAIIEELHIDFSHGFHALTGETGAGKSILIDALGLVIGGRASADFVRHGKEKAEIEAVFELNDLYPIALTLEENGIDCDDTTLWIRREIFANGKSTCRINGRLVTLGTLKQIGSRLINIHGQHEHQALFNVDEHIEWLDQYGGKELLHIRRKYQDEYRKYLEIERELSKLNRDEQELAKRMDLLEYQMEEIKGARLVVGEDDELEVERKRLTYTEKLMAHVGLAYQAMYGEQRGLDLIQQSLSELEDVADLDPQLASVHEQLVSICDQLDDVVRELGDYQENLEFDPKRLDEVQERVHLIHQLKRKYGETIPDILGYQEKIELELEQLSDLDVAKEELEEQRDEIREVLITLALELTQRRKRVAAELETRIERELADLHMGSTVFHVAFYPPADRGIRLLPLGQDSIEYQIAPNPGEPLRPLAKIASGGEVSRIMLALKSIFADIDQVDTLIFDEIDTGVSGRAAQAIAEKIAVLAKRNQILCVTHLPQVACMADHHFYISKKTSNDSTRTSIETLDRSQRILELARMLGGVEVTEKTKEHAEEMIRLADLVKQKEVI